MTVTVQTPVTTTTANGSTATFPFAFKILAEADLKVYLDDVLQASGFTVSGVGSATGSITFSSNPSNGTVVKMLRDVSLERETDYQNAGDFLADEVDEDFDRAWLAIQDVDREVGESIRAPAGESLPKLSAAAARANKYLTFDDEGNPVATLSAAPDPGTGDSSYDYLYLDGGSFSLLSAITTGTYTPTVGDIRTVQYHSSGKSASIALWRCVALSATAPDASDGINTDGYFYTSASSGNASKWANVSAMMFVEHWGAAGDFVSDDFPALSAANEYAYAVGGGRVYFLPSAYGISETFEVYPNILFVGATSRLSSDTKGTSIKLLANADCDVVRTKPFDGTLDSVNDYLSAGGFYDIKLDGNKANQTGANDPVMSLPPVAFRGYHMINLYTLKRCAFVSCIGNGYDASNSSTPAQVEYCMSNNNDGYGYNWGSNIYGVLGVGLTGDDNKKGANNFEAMSAINGYPVFIKPHFEGNRSDFHFEDSNGYGIITIGHSSVGVPLNASITSSSTTVTLTGVSSEKRFYATDVGKVIRIPGAGPASTTLVTTIATYVSETQATVTDAASTTVSYVSTPTAYIGSLYHFEGTTAPRLKIMGLSAPISEACIIHNDIDDVVTQFGSSLDKWFDRNYKGISYYEDWRSVGGTGEPAFTNSWGNTGAPYQAARFRKDSVGVVHLEGTITGGTSGNSAFTLPVGYRPASRLVYALMVVGGTGAVEIRVNSDGTIVPTSSGSVTNVHINLSFSVA